MIDFLGYLVTSALAAVIIGVVALWIDATRRTQVTLILGLSLWWGVAVAVSTAGLMVTRPDLPPVLGMFVAVPLVAGALAALTAGGRRVMLSLPLKVVLALNIGRAAGALFLIMGWQGRLGGAFPVSAGSGDLITGVAAALILLAGADRSRGVVMLWNLFGAADLISAIALGVTSTDGSPLQLIHASPGANAVGHAPWSLIPGALVPFYLVMHGIVWAQLARKPAPAAAT